MEDVVAGMSQAAVRESRAASPTRMILTEEEIQALHDAEKSLEFGQDDLDDEMLEAEGLEQPRVSVNKLPLGQVDGANTAMAIQDLVAQPNVSSLGNRQKQSTPDLPVQTPDIQSMSDDEFEDIDADEFAADLEDVFAKYESQQPAPEAESSGYQQVHTSLEAENIDHKPLSTEALVEILSSDGEDFGNDSDFEQLAAECAEATQNKQTQSPSQLNV